MATSNNNTYNDTISISKMLTGLMSEADMPLFTEAQQKALSFCPKIPAALSILGSSALCYHVVREIRKRQLTTIHPNIIWKISSHLNLGMGIANFFAALAFFFTTWPIPRELRSEGNLAIGTQGTCSTQGFFIQLGSMTAAMYNAALAFFYFLTINRKWNGSQLLKMQPFFHINAILWGLGTAIACLALTLFNDTGWCCWIRAAPLDCKETFWYGSEGTCTRGDNATIYKLALYYIPVWMAIIIVTAFMICIFLKIRDQEQRMAQFGNGSNQHSLRNAKRFARQATLFAGAFYATWLFPTIYNLILAFGGPIYFSMLFLNAISLPMQGFLNFIVYIHPRYKQYMKKHPNTSCVCLYSWVLMLCEEFLVASTTSETEGLSGSEENGTSGNNTQSAIQAT